MARNYPLGFLKRTPFGRLPVHRNAEIHWFALNSTPDSPGTA